MKVNLFLFTHFLKLFLFDHCLAPVLNEHITVITSEVRGMLRGGHSCTDLSLIVCL